MPETLIIPDRSWPAWSSGSLPDVGATGDSLESRSFAAGGTFTMTIRGDARKYARGNPLRQADARISELAAVLDLDDEEIARLFGIDVSTLDNWRSEGVPPARSADVDRLADLAYVLARELKPDRIPQIVRTRDDWLGGRNMLEVMRHEGVEPIYQYLLRLFSYSSV